MYNEYTASIICHLLIVHLGNNWWLTLEMTCQLMATLQHSHSYSNCLFVRFRFFPWFKFHQPFFSILFRSIPLTIGICMQLLCNFYISLVKSNYLFILFCGPQKTTKRLNDKYYTIWQIFFWFSFFFLCMAMIRFFLWVEWFVFFLPG